MTMNLTIYMHSPLFLLNVFSSGTWMALVQQHKVTW